MKSNKVYFLLVAVLFLMPFYVAAQQNFGGKPYSLLNTKLQKNISVAKLPPVNLYSLYAEDNAEQEFVKPIRIGINHNVSYSNKNCGTWDTLANGDKIWRMAFYSKGALAMSVAFSRFVIPDGAELFVYNKDYKLVLGSFINKNMLDDSTFYTQQLFGDSLFLEYYEPKKVSREGELVIEAISHFYKEFSTKTPVPDSSQSCQINVACAEGDNWRDQIRSVAYYELHSTDAVYLCSGALVNNTAQDGKQYFLSAHHCQDGVDVKRWIFYFNYQTTTCNGYQGVLDNSVAGAKIVALLDRDKGSDFLLLEITAKIPESYNVYLAGWDRTTTATSGACIHHPSGDWKKISIPQAVKPTYTDFWEVNWIARNPKGTTEPGSSGSPLFNAQKRIIGQLYGGSSTCADPYGSDYYGRISYSWASSRLPASSLRPWLDPLGKNAMSLEGVDAKLLSEETVTDNSVEEIILYPNPAKDLVKLLLPYSAKGQKIICTIYSVSGNKLSQKEHTVSSLELDVDVSNLTSGNYIVEILQNGKKTGLNFSVVK